MSEEKVDEKRRTFLKGILAASILSAIAGVSSVGSYISSPSATQYTTYPRVKIANIKDLKVGQPLRFCYPLTGEVSVLIKVGERVENGVGPDGDIVAFSVICQHLGCIVSLYFQEKDNIYNKYSKVLICPCHLSVYDVKNNAKVLAGPAPRRLPRVILDYDSNTGDIYAVGMEGPVILGQGPPGLEGVNLPQNLKPGFIGGEPVNEKTILTCGTQA